MGNSLSGKVTLIIGGTGNLGTHIVQYFLNEGAQVIVPASSAQEINSLKQSLKYKRKSKLVTFLTDMQEYSNVDVYADLLMQNFKHIDLAVTYLPLRAKKKSISEISFVEWQSMNNCISEFFIATRVLINHMLTPDSMYVSISDVLPSENHFGLSMQYLASLFQLEVAGLFAHEASKITTNYRHLYINFDGTYPVSSESNCYQSLAKWLIKLYQKKLNDADRIIHQLSFDDLREDNS